MLNLTEEPLHQQLDILWEPAEDGARILRVYGEQPALRLPEYIGQRSVTEIGPYCFSRSEPKLPEQYFHFYTDESRTERPVPQTENGRISAAESDPGAAHRRLSCLGGSTLTSVWLPTTVHTLHNAAFYNCRELHTLSAGAGIRSIGSDEFMNCTRLSRLIMRCADTEAEGLPLLLERYAEDLLVLFMPESPASDCPAFGSSSADASKSSSENAIQGALFFPEYYEWLDEISPAHIFSRSIHGEGFRMRKCFENGRINYEKYDQCFENALKVESANTLCRIAIARLRWPAGLKEEARTLYEHALKENLRTAITLAVRDRDLALLLFLCRYFSAGDYGEAIASCVDADWGEGSARLMEEQHRNGSFSRKSFSFDDFSLDDL